MYGTNQNTFFFDKGKDEVMESLDEYISYLKKLVKEAKTKFK